MHIPFQQRMAHLRASLHGLCQVHSPREFFWSTVKQLWPAYLLASILILYGFGWGLPDNPYQDKSFHADENAAVWAVNQISFPFFYPRWLPWGTALFYQVYLIKTVFAAVGLIHIEGVGEFDIVCTDHYWIYVIGRLMVYFSALGAITMTFFIGRKLFDAWTGRLAAILLAVLPGFVINSHYFKTDVPMTFWLLAAVFAAFQLIRSGKFVYVVLLGLLVGYSASTKYNAVALFPAGLVAIAMTNRKLGKRRSCIYYVACVAVGFIVGTPYALYAPGLINALRMHAANNATNPYYGRPPAWLDYPVYVLSFSLTRPMLIATACSLVWIVIKDGKRLLPIWVFLLFYSLLLGMDNLRVVRYTVPLLPFAALFVAYSISTLMRIRFVRPIAGLGACAIVAYVLLFSLSYVQVMAQTDPRIQASCWIEEHIPDDVPMAVSTTHYLDIPQIQLMGYEKVEVGHSVAKLQEAESPYLILSDFGALMFQQAIDRYPQQNSFFDYVRKNYTEVVHFENSQKLLGVDSKSGSRLPHDWLQPNPKITIIKRRYGNPPSIQ